MLSQGSTLIIDDKIEDGQPISEQLKRLYIPHLFFHADEIEILNFTNNKVQKIKQVRTIFQDINLTGGASPSTQDYDKAATIIETLLEPNNGPWLLVTWSTWSSEDNNEYGKKLFDHLRKELQPGQRPYDFISTDKALFTISQHGNVIEYEKLGHEAKILFSSKIKKVLSETSPMDAMMAWEGSINNAVSETMADLHALSTGKVINAQENHDNKLGKLLLELSKAELGQSINSGNSQQGLINILNNQLSDRVEYQNPPPIDLTSYKGVASWGDIKEWKRKINRILHFSTNSNSSGPGTIYTYDSFLKATTTCYSNESGTATAVSIIDEQSIKNSFNNLVEAFTFDDNEQGLANKKALLDCISAASLIVVDITPPCDHAQNKAFWLKFCGGIFIDCEKLTRKQNDILVKVLKTPEYLWNSCPISLDEENYKNSELVLNSRLVFTAIDDANVKNILIHAKVTKIQEQITRDLTHWMGRQLTRPGYAYM